MTILLAAGVVGDVLSYNLLIGFALTVGGILAYHFARYHRSAGHVAISVKEDDATILTKQLDYPSPTRRVLSAAVGPAGGGPAR